MEKQEKSPIPEGIEGTTGNVWKREGKSERVGKTDKENIVDLMKKQPLDKESKAWAETRSQSYGKSLTYGEFEEVMDRSGLTVRDLFGAMGVEIVWPNETFRTIAEICEKLPQETLEKVRDMVVKTVPNWCWAINEEKPSLKLMEASIRRTVMLRERTKSGKDPLAKRKSNRLVRLKPQEMVDESARMGISMHWVLNLKPKYLIYGTKPEIEEILDGFSFMQPSLRESFVAALKEMVKKEEGGG